MIDMSKIEDHYDKTFILYVLEKLDISAYQLAKMAEVSEKTFTNVKRFNCNLGWKLIRKIEKTTNLTFKSQEHIIYSVDFYRDNPDLFKES